MWPYKDLWPSEEREKVITYLKIIWKDRVKTEEKEDNLLNVFKERDQILEVCCACICTCCSSLDYLLSCSGGGLFAMNKNYLFRRNVRCLANGYWISVKMHTKMTALTTRKREGIDPA